MKIIYVPRDPRKKNIVFLAGHPDCLLKMVDNQIWEDTINEINNIIASYSKLDFYTTFCNIFILPMLFNCNNNVDKNLYSYLRYKNNILMKYGIYICHPMTSDYTEIRVIIN